MTFTPRSWRQKHRGMTQEQAGAAIGLTLRGWQEMERGWASVKVGNNTPRRTEMACMMADILMCKDSKRAAYLAARFYRDFHSIKK